MAEIKLVGSRITKISGEREPEFNGKLSINTNIQILSYEKAKEAKDTLKVSYKLEVDYAELGKVFVNGILFISTDSKTVKDIQKSWKDKKFDTPEQITITNLIIRKASIKAFSLEEELGLPLHIQLPTLGAKK